MDNLTHALTGAALSKAGLDRTTPLATATLVIAANVPDIDMVSYVNGVYFALAHRRGITHGAPALVVLPFVVTAAILAWDRWVRRRRDARAAPARPLAVLGLAFVGLLTHSVLDWMNTYGMRWRLPLKADAEEHMPLTIERDPSSRRHIGHRGVVLDVRLPEHLFIDPRVILKATLQPVLETIADLGGHKSPGHETSWKEPEERGGGCVSLDSPPPNDGSRAFVFRVPNRDHPEGGTKGSTTGALLNPNDLDAFVLGQPLVYLVFENLLILTFPRPEEPTAALARRVIHAEYLDTHSKALRLQMSLVFAVSSTLTAPCITDTRSALAVHPPIRIWPLR